MSSAAWLRCYCILSRLDTSSRHRRRHRASYKLARGICAKSGVGILNSVCPLFLSRLLLLLLPLLVPSSSQPSAGRASRIPLVSSCSRLQPLSLCRPKPLCTARLSFSNERAPSATEKGTENFQVPWRTYCCCCS